MGDDPYTPHALNTSPASLALSRHILLYVAYFHRFLSENLDQFPFAFHDMDATNSGLYVSLGRIRISKLHIGYI